MIPVRKSNCAHRTSSLSYLQVFFSTPRTAIIPTAEKDPQQTEKSPQLLVLLGSSVRAMAQSCRYLHIPVWAVDQFADSDCRAVAYRVTQKELQDVTIDDFPRDLSLLFLPGGGTENHASLTEQLAHSFSWCGLSGKALRAIRDPECLFPIASQCGLKIPSTFFFSDRTKKSDLEQMGFENLLPDQWLWKSSDRGGGLGVSDIETWDVLKYLLTIQADGYLQEKIHAEAFGATIILSQQGEPEWIGASRLLTAGKPLPYSLLSDKASKNYEHEHSPSSRRTDYPYLFGGAIGPVPLPQTVVDRLLSFAKQCYQCFGIKGWFQVDFMLNHQGDLWLLEINPRWSATMEIYERIQGHSLVSPHLRAWGVDAKEHDFPKQIPHSLILKYVVYASATFTWTTAQSQKASDINRKAMDANGWPILADLPQENTTFESGMPILTILASGYHLADIYQYTQQMIQYLCDETAISQ
jgi:predicted ATP-grasp superfamily ATP-dependent carboligase